MEERASRSRGDTRICDKPAHVTRGPDGGVVARIVQPRDATPPEGWHVKTPHQSNKNLVVYWFFLTMLVAIACALVSLLI